MSRFRVPGQRGSRVGARWPGAALLPRPAELLRRPSGLVACAQPAISFGVVVPALWSRSAYGTTGRLSAHAAAMCLAVSVAVPLWGVVPGQASWTAAAPVFGSLPVILINTVIARHLALGLFDRDQGLERDTALATLGSRLIGVTDRKQVIAASWVTAEAICRATVEDSLRSPQAATAACAATRTRTGLCPMK